MTSANVGMNSNKNIESHSPQQIDTNKTQIIVNSVDNYHITNKIYFQITIFKFIL